MSHRFTKEEVSEALNVSVSYVDKLIAENKLRYVEGYGIDFHDLNKYIEDCEKRRQEALSELVRQAQELGLYD